MTPKLDITDEDEATLLESITKHNKLTVELFDCWCEERITEIQLEIEFLRLERVAIIKKYEKEVPRIENIKWDPSLCL